MQRRCDESDLNAELQADALLDVEAVLEVKHRELRAAMRKRKAILKDQVRLERVQRILEDLDTLAHTH